MSDTSLGFKEGSRINLGGFIADPSKKEVVDAASQILGFNHNVAKYAQRQNSGSYVGR